MTSVNYTLETEEELQKRLVDERESFVRGVMNDLSIPDYQQKEIIALYSEPHRHYHNLDHICTLLKHARHYERDHPIKAVIIYHDVVYYPNSKYNEELSAYMYHSNAQLGLIRSYNPRVPRSAWTSEENYRMIGEGYNAIQSSKNHTDEDNENAPKWVRDFLDYDLQGLASPYYTENAQKIWKEFEPFVERQQFIDGRMKFLKNMLHSKRIFWNNGREWEAKARRNMMIEYEALKADNYDFHIENVDTIYTYGENNANGS